MIRFVRIIGFLLMVAGVLAILSYLIEPLRELWPHLIQWFTGLPIGIQIGLVIAAFGFLLLFGSVIWERLEDQRNEQDLLEE